MNQPWKKYLFWFAHEHVDFRKPEMESILKMLGTNLRIIKKPKQQPYWIVESQSEIDIKKVVNRSVLLRFCLELWGSGLYPDELHKNLKNYPLEEINKHTGENKSFKVIVETFCKHFTQREKVNKIETFSYLPLRGPVQLKDPDTTLCYIEYYGLEPNNIPEKPVELFFGRWIADGRRDLIQKLSLKSRKFIGNTSMDAQLSVIMANQAQVKSGDIVLDPFVGSGSLLVAASYFGGYTIGTDIDFLMLHGRTRPSRITQKKREKDENIAANMKQYGLSSYYLDSIVSDFASPLWRSSIQFDAIITDPPYGIREPTERVGTAKSNPAIEEHQLSTHIPSKIDYQLPHIFKDLLTFSAKHLKTNGRLVCWFPLYRDQYSDSQLPSHPCLSLQANSEQILSKYTSRRLLTYIKIKEPMESDKVKTTNLCNFREQYFALRDETRKERRMKRAEERAKNKEDWFRNKNNFER